MGSQLSEGALATIMQGGDFINPVVQVLSVKKMNTGSGQPEKDRYRAFLSDGKYTVSFAMMTAPVYAKAGDKGLTKYSIMTIKKFITSVINNTEGRDSRVLLILDLEVLADGDDIKEKIGNPEPYSEIAAKANGAQNGTSRTHSSSNGSRNEGPASKMPKLMPSVNTNASASTNSSTSANLNGSLTGHITHPISSLSPYHNKWVIKARVSNKSAIRTWSNSRGEGKLFSMDLVDESGEIRCTVFRDLVDKLYDTIQVDKVYYISKCQLKTANKQFCALKNDYEMTTVPESIIEECHDDDLSNVPQTKYEFKPISSIAEIDANEFIDVIGVAKSTSDLQTFTARSSGRELKKKEVQLIDQSNACVTLTLWGSEAENFDGSSNPIIVLKGAKVSEFGGGKTLSTVSSTMFKINPDLKECFQLRGWYDKEGCKIDVSDLSARSGAGGSFNTPWYCFKEAADQQLGSINTEKGDYYQVKGTVLLIRTENCLYKACPSAECNKKVIDQNNGMYRCEKCNKEYENYKYRLLCSMNVGDWSGNQWISMFSDESEKVVGMTAQEAGMLQETDGAAFAQAMEKVHFKQFLLKCRAKMEVYNDEQRLKTVAVRVEPVNHEEYNSYLIESINKIMKY